MFPLFSWEANLGLVASLRVVLAIFPLPMGLPRCRQVREPPPVPGKATRDPGLAQGS